MPNEAHNKELVRRAFDAWRAGTGSPFDLLAEAAEWTIVGRSAASNTYTTRDAFMNDVIRPFNARMSGHLVPTVHNIYADGDTVIVYFEAGGTARDEKAYHNTYAWFLELRDDRIVRAVAFYDSVEFNELWDRVQPA